MADVTLPNSIAVGQQRSAAKVQQNDEALRDGVNALFPVIDSDLQSSNNSVYKTVLNATSPLFRDAVAGTYPIRGWDLAAGAEDADPSPTNIIAFAATEKGTGLPAIYIDDADYTVGSLTSKLRVRAQVSTNGTAPAITFTFGLYPVTFSGGTDILIATLGTVVASSTVAIATPAANLTTSGVGTDVNVPTDGLYCLGVVTSATLANNAACMVSAQLQARNT